MDHDQFQLLALKHLAGEASQDEEMRLHQHLEESVEASAEMAQWKEGWSLARGAVAHDCQEAASVEAMRGTTGTVYSALPTFPNHRMGELLEAVKSGGPFSVIDGEAKAPQPEVVSIMRRPPLRRFAWFAAAAAAVAVAIMFMPRQKDVATDSYAGFLVIDRGEVMISRSGQTLKASASTALFPSDSLTLSADADAVLLTKEGTQKLTSGASVLMPKPGMEAEKFASNGFFKRSPQVLLSMLALSVARGTNDQGLVYPAPTTGVLNPHIHWHPDQSGPYRVVLTEAREGGSEVFSKTVAEPPIAVQGLLQPSQIYRITIARETGPMLSDRFLHVSSQAIELPTIRSEAGQDFYALGSALAEAWRCLDPNHPRYGDALMIVDTVAPAHRDSELALRIRAVAAAGLGLAEELDRTKAQLGKQ